MTTKDLIIDSYREEHGANHSFVHPAGEEMYAVWLPNTIRPKLFELKGQAIRFAQSNTDKADPRDMFGARVVILDADPTVEDALVASTEYGKRAVRK